MRIGSMGDGIFDDTQADLDGKPCIVLLADSREELRAALQGLSIRIGHGGGARGADREQGHMKATPTQALKDQLAESRASFAIKRKFSLVFSQPATTHDGTRPL